MTPYTSFLVQENANDVLSLSIRRRISSNPLASAEVRRLQWMGADAVGMSTVAEASAAFACGMHVCAISCITNYAAGISKVPLDHREVVETGKAVAGKFAALLTRAAPELVARLG